MPTAGTAKWPKPNSEDEFENIALDALRIRWGDPNATRNGRRGQAQQGIDIVGRSRHRTGALVGAQCKNTESPTIAQVVEEARKATAFKPALAEFLFVTAADRDTRLQEQVRLHFEEHPAPFPVEVVFWDDLIHEMNGQPHLFEKHWPTLPAAAGDGPVAPTNREILEEIRRQHEHLAALQSGGDSFCYWMLYNFSLENHLARDFVIIRSGRYPVYDVRLRIRDMDAGRDLLNRQWGEINSPADYILVKWPLPETVYYRAFFFARNGSWNQDLILRRSSAAKCWLAATRVVGTKGEVRLQEIDNGFTVEFGEPEWRP